MATVGGTAMLKQCFANCAWRVPPTSAFLTHTQTGSDAGVPGHAQFRDEVPTV